MKNKVKFTLVLLVALCMVLSSIVFATEGTPNMATVVDPETGEILEATPRLGGEDGYQGIMPISGELNPEDLMPISDDLLDGGMYNANDYTADEEEEDDDNNTIIFIAAGAGILVLIIIVAVMMKKQ